MGIDGYCRICGSATHRFGLGRDNLVAIWRGSLEDPMSKRALSEVERGNEVILEIAPSYYSAWDFSEMG